MLMRLTQAFDRLVFFATTCMNHICHNVCLSHFATFVIFAHICSYLLILSHNVCLLSHSLAIAFFSVEYVTRLVLCPKKWK